MKNENEEKEKEKEYNRTGEGNRKEIRGSREKRQKKKYFVSLFTCISVGRFL